jgi:integrase
MNGIGVYMRTFRAICNRAINLDFVGYEWYPFRKYKIQKSKTTPRVLSMEEIKSYFQLDLQEDDPEFKYWHLGKLIFMLRGINMRDLLLLKKENIVNGRLIYKRAKTGKIYSIALTGDIEASLGVFSSNTSLLGLINLDKCRGENSIKYLQQHVKVINHHLKNLSKLIESKEPITTYVFRYSYANVAKQLGYSKDMIAEALGHEYGNSVTGIYLEQFDLYKVDEMNQILIKFLHN